MLHIMYICRYWKSGRRLQRHLRRHRLVSLGGGLRGSALSFCSPSLPPAFALSPPLSDRMPNLRRENLEVARFDPSRLRLSRGWISAGQGGSPRISWPEILGCGDSYFVNVSCVLANKVTRKRIH